jgi:hypothetical protein
MHFMLSTNSFFRLASTGALIFTMSASASEVLTCPQSIVTNQSTVANDGWIARQESPSRKHALRAAGFTDGPPEDGAQLKPATAGKTKAGEKVSFAFSGVSPAGIWLECAYADTTVTLSKKIEKTPSACDVNYIKTARPGSAVSIGIACR